MVDDFEIAEAMRSLFADTHNAIEGAGAAALAGASKDAPVRGYARVGVVLTGGNVDASVFADVLEPGAAKLNVVVCEIRLEERPREFRRCGDDAVVDVRIVCGEERR